MQLWAHKSVLNSACRRHFARPSAPHLLANQRIDFSGVRRQQRVEARGRRLSCKALFGSTGREALKAAEAAKAVAAARSEAILKMPLWQHSMRCLVVVALATWAAAYLSKVLHKEADRVEAGEEAAWSIPGEEDTPVSQQPFPLQVANAALQALHRPAAVFLPVVACTLSFRAAAMFLDVCTIYGGKNKLPNVLATVVSNMSFCLRALETLITGFSEVAAIVFIVWSVIRLKEKLVKIFVGNEQGSNTATGGRKSSQEEALERIVLPLSGLASWLTVLSGVLMALNVMGINIQPLLTVGGVSGVIVGLSAQSVVSNMISGVNLFLSRPFVVGERIDISHSSGAKLLTGYVERVDPMRTILRTDTCMPVMIPNKVLADMIISNESRLNRSYVVSSFRKARQYLATLSVRYQDMGAVERIVADMRVWLEASPGVDRNLPLFVGLASLDNHACNINVLLHTTGPMSREFGSFRQKLLLEFGRIIDQHKAKLAMPTRITQVDRLDSQQMVDIFDTDSVSENGSDAPNGAAEESSTDAIAHSSA